MSIELYFNNCVQLCIVYCIQFVNNLLAVAVLRMSIEQMFCSFMYCVQLFSVIQGVQMTYQYVVKFCLKWKCFF
jgi:hypothetical protein